MTRIFYLFLFWISAQANVSALYLTWQEDPTTTMTIYWHTPEYDTNDTIYLQSKSLQWHAIVGSHNPLHYVMVHTVHLARLEPGTDYIFRVGDDPTVYQFTTAPSRLTKPMRFIIGGDAYYKSSLFEKMNKQMIAYDPLFCVIGGDIAYALQGSKLHLAVNSFNRWIEFLVSWKKQCITEKGRIIPFLLTPGNHDISPDHKTLFFDLFPPETDELYRVVNFGNYLSVFLLDSGHLSPIAGAQTTWLEQTLIATKNVPFRLAIYHESAYPSYYPYKGKTAQQIRTSWCPLFDKYALTAAFENHNHAFKKTHPLKNNQIDPEGIIYFGDGAWGVPPRKPNSRWYLEKESQENNVYVVEVQTNDMIVKAININGEALDTTTFHAMAPQPQTAVPTAKEQ